MNFIKQSIAFHNCIEENELHPSEIALWDNLFHLWNRAHWAKWFPAKNLELTLHDQSMTVPTVHHARNILKQKGFIDFKTQGRNKKTWYSLTILFDEDDDDFGYGYDNEPIDGTLKESLRQSLNQVNTVFKQQTGNTIKLNKNNRAGARVEIPIYKLGE